MRSTTPAFPRSWAGLPRDALTMASPRPWSGTSTKAMPGRARFRKPDVVRDDRVSEPAGSVAGCLGTGCGLGGGLPQASRGTRALCGRAAHGRASEASVRSAVRAIQARPEAAASVLLQHRSTLLVRRDRHGPTLQRDVTHGAVARSTVDGQSMQAGTNRTDEDTCRCCSSEWGWACSAAG